MISTSHSQLPETPETFPSQALFLLRVHHADCACGRLPTHQTSLEKLAFLVGLVQTSLMPAFNFYLPLNAVKCCGQ